MVCHKCHRQWEWRHQLFTWQHCPVEIFYEYGPFFQQQLYRFKALGDVALAPIFLHLHRNYLRWRYAGYTITYAPSAAAHINERGFHHLKMIYDQVPLPKAHVYKKTTSYRQADQPLMHRQNIRQVIQLLHLQRLPKKCLIVDDVMTTGETLQTLIALARQEGVKDIKVFVLARKTETYNHYKAKQT
jgi:competence protein ComFC